jgi:hypothetical protein
MRKLQQQQPELRGSLNMRRSTEGAPAPRAAVQPPPAAAARPATAAGAPRRTRSGSMSGAPAAASRTAAAGTAVQQVPGGSYTAAASAAAAARPAGPPRPTAPAAARPPGQLARPAVIGRPAAAFGSTAGLKGRQPAQRLSSSGRAGGPAVGASAESVQLKAAIRQLQAQISEETSELKRIMAAATTTVTRVGGAVVWTAVMWAVGWAVCGLWDGLCGAVVHSAVVLCCCGGSACCPLPAALPAALHPALHPAHHAAGSSTQTPLTPHPSPLSPPHTHTCRRSTAWCQCRRWVVG